MAPPADARLQLETVRLTALYGRRAAVKDVSLMFPRHTVTALIGPSGCGKTTFLRCLNRMHELSEGGWITGKVLLDGEDIYDPSIDAIRLRRRIGMVFQRPTPFPTMSIYDNVAAGLRVNGGRPRTEVDATVEGALRRAALWDEVKDRLRHSALALSGGQQQRLCVARALAPEPDVLLLDEPTASLDPAGTQHIEELCHELKTRYTICIVTHNLQQAARVSDYTAFFYLGDLIEIGHRRAVHQTDARADRGVHYGEVRMTTVGQESSPPFPLSATRRGGQGERSVRLSDRPSPILDVRTYSFWYGPTQALFDVTVAIPRRAVTALIGPSGCGKSTFLRSVNRLNELIPHTRHAGDILLEGVSVFSKGTDPVALRREVGMVFQQPNPFPKTIFDNVAYGPRLNGLAPERDMPERVERALRQAALWDEVKDRLQTPGTGLSGGQQQRLCIARALANEPEVLLLDEPCSALDPGATQRIEELLVELKQSYSILIVTHNMQQASRASDFTGFFYLGHLIEFGPTKQLFTRPADERTEAYITGRFG